MQLCFFFQAEDGIRDYKVTGVQTCALPICAKPLGPKWPRESLGEGLPWPGPGFRPASFVLMESHLSPQGSTYVPLARFNLRSEERRVGKEAGSRRQSQSKNKARGQERARDG